MQRCATGRAEPRGFNRIPHRDRRTGHVRKGRPGTRDEVSALLSRTGTERQEKSSRPGVERSERAVGAATWGNPLQGTPPSKGARRRTDPQEGKMTETSSSQDVSTKLVRIAKLAKELRGTSLMTLAHHIDVDWLREAYRRTRKDGARGVDGQSAEAYAEQLEANLQSLLDRAKSGRYRAPPVRRVHIRERPV